MKRVYAHLKQPSSSCFLEFQNRLKRSRRKHQKQRSKRHMTDKASNQLELPPLETLGNTFWDSDYALDVEMNAPETVLEGKYPHFVEQYLGMVEIHGHGPTFMDRFNSDEHSYHCENLPFYPFTSQEEWELASFLLHSDLSMSKLDEFLKLAMVCYYMLDICILLILGFHRSKASSCPLAQQTLCAVWQRSFHLDQNGSLNFGNHKRIIQRRRSSNSSIETPLNVSRHFLRVCSFKITFILPPSAFLKLPKNLPVYSQSGCQAMLLGKCR